MNSSKGKGKSMAKIPIPPYTSCLLSDGYRALAQPTTRRSLFTRKRMCPTLPPQLWANIAKRLAITRPDTIIHFAMSSRENAKTVRELVFPTMSLKSLYYTLPSLTSVRFKGLITLWVEHGNVDACIMIATYIGWYKDYADSALTLLDNLAMKGEPQAIYNAQLLHRMLAPHRFPKSSIAPLIVERHHYDNTKFNECRENFLLMLTCGAMEKGEPGGRHCTEVGVQHRDVSPGVMNFDGMSCPECILDWEAINMRGLI